MSESSYKITASGRRQPTKRRQKLRKVQKPGNTKVKAVGTSRSLGRGQLSPDQGETISRTVISSSSSTAKTPRKRERIEAPAETWLRKKNASQAASSGMKSAAVNGKIPPLKFKTRVTKRVKLSHKTRLKPMARTMLYILRLLIVGVGIGAIVGTLLSVLDPATQVTTANLSNVEQNQPQVANNNQGFYLTQEIIPLKSSIQILAGSNPDLTPGVFIADLDTGNYVDLNANSAFAAASTIKLPILVAFFQDVDAGKIQPNEMLVMEQRMVAGGSGDMQSQPVGSKFTALEVATKMMVISDNTATNILIDRMGGIEALNQRFRSWGLTATVLRNQLPDIEGTNTTSPKELGQVLAMVSKGNLVPTTASRDRILDIMRQNQRRHLLPTGLGVGAEIGNKTGYIGAMLGDVGLINLPTGKRYIAAVMVKRPRNDSRAETLITSVSRLAYQYFNQPPSMTGTPGTNILPPSGNSPYLNNPINGTIPYQPPQMNTVPSGVNNTIPTTTYPQYYYPYQNQR
ncbi:serine hydrolase [Plectonema cf. radiosum LEGE 06105]|uniref:Serine hydrolase n=1 Tax=Plectonema cf. radiosum LEGE 06105 TaxID=945769 RepID=A0A8J7F462_9CYAN|nr:serine hydrolase [Plectonema radiosum]MBE9212079.1 serine hydrolase [Plectonema cf. radiosum LEGE 06105]